MIGGRVGPRPASSTLAQAPSDRARAGAAIAVAAAIVVGSFGVAASAASLGGLSPAHLFAWSSVVSVPVPLVVGGGGFTCSGDLGGDVDDHGNGWSDHAGDWQCLGGGFVRARQRVPLASATVDLGISDGLYLTAGLVWVSDQSDRSGPGISLLSDGISHMFAIYERDHGRISLGKREFSVVTSLATATVADRSTAELRVEISQPVIRVLVDGAQVITHTMSTTEMISFGSNTRFGVEADDDNQSRVDWFRAEA